MPPEVALAPPRKAPIPMITLIPISA